VLVSAAVLGWQGWNTDRSATTHPKRLRTACSAR